MRKTTLLVLAAALCVPAFATAAPVLTAGFSPSDGRPALEIVLGAINNARQSIDVAAYSFTSKPVATALAGKNVQTGSFNYTASAVSRNAENVLLIEDAPQLAETYQREFNRLWDEGTPLNALY
ncbi:phospholipase D-like domain-containing protein [Salmonella enterica]|uniref:phospholipase D-like domain-containing protein n=1 Tax=Enterobacteriaceae TaxID=543 RepID=UPI000CF0777D|nr:MULTISPECIES: phospholipase D-like domain-containing protein [Enterobacteriaceae]MEA1392239.1 phospholipase D-like domain-containing protein [Salmonella enterica]PPW38440.1 phospholipase D family protein [Escherichia coli]